MVVCSVFLTAFLGLLCYHANGESRTNFKVLQHGLCRRNTLIKYSAEITNEGKSQYLSFNFTTPVPLDENIGVTCDIKTILNNKTTIHLFTIREKYFCRAANTFMGEFWYDIVRAAQLIPGLCPIPAGRYHGHHIYLNYQNIALQTFPFGKIRFIFNLIDNKQPTETLLCVNIDVENMPN